jgi:ammonia channel protein AmtB
MRAFWFYVGMAVGLVLLLPQAASAYVGPGGALVGGVILGILGFVWYPIKRLLRAVSGRSRTAAEGEDA